MTIKNRQVAFMTRRQQAVRQARQEFQKPEFAEEWKKRREAVEQIRQYLHYPNFDFTQEEWSKFYGIYELGHLHSDLPRPGLSPRETPQRGTAPSC